MHLWSMWIGGWTKQLSNSPTGLAGRNPIGIPSVRWGRSMERPYTDLSVWKQHCWDDLFLFITSGSTLSSTLRRCWNMLEYTGIHEKNAWNQRLAIQADWIYDDLWNVCLSTRLVEQHTSKVRRVTKHLGGWSSKSRLVGAFNMFQHVSNIHHNCDYIGDMMIDDIWWYMMIYDDIWWYVMIYDDIWGYMRIYCDIWLYTIRLMIYDDIWWYMMIYDDIWWYMRIYCDIWWYMMIYDDMWWYMMIYDDIWGYIVIYDDIRSDWWYMMIYDDIWWYMWYMMIYDDIWWYMMADDVWWYMMIYDQIDDIWWYMMVDDVWWYMMVYDFLTVFFFQVVILLKCLLMPGFPFCRGQWLWKSQTCTKKRGWAPWFCRENPLLDLWQVPHSVEVWGPKSQIWLQNGDTQPPQVIFWGSIYDDIWWYARKNGTVRLGIRSACLGSCSMQSLLWSQSEKILWTLIKLKFLSEILGREQMSGKSHMTISLKSLTDVFRIFR